MHSQNRHTAASMTSANMAKHDNQISAETVRMHKADLKMGWPYKDAIAYTSKAKVGGSQNTMATVSIVEHFVYR